VPSTFLFHLGSSPFRGSLKHPLQARVGAWTEILPLHCVQGQNDTILYDSIFKVIAYHNSPFSKGGKGD